MCNAVHRVIEQQAAARPDAPALVAPSGALTYRELNQRANTLARRLCESGLTRGSLAIVRMPRSADLALVLLAVLKAGASYTWLEPGSPNDIELPTTFCIVAGSRRGEDRYLAVDISRAIRDSASRPGPNLPVLSRPSDVACVMMSGGSHVLVPHATLAALPQGSEATVAGWRGDAGAFDLWAGLMSGAAVSLMNAAPVTAAA